MSPLSISTPVVPTPVGTSPHRRTGSGALTRAAARESDSPAPVGPLARVVRTIRAYGVLRLALIPAVAFLIAALAGAARDALLP